MQTLPRIAEIDAWCVDGTIKGYPGTAPPRPLGTIGASGWIVLDEDLPLPVAVLKASALAHNRDWMRRFLAASSAALCPHGKTTMSPQLFAAQLEDGAFGITCATVSQLQVCRRFGVRRVFMANQVVDRQGLAYVAAELARDREFELYLIVDSVEGIRRLATVAAVAELVRPMRVLIEVGAPGARTGARSLAEVDALVAAIEAEAPRLALHGVEAFEDVVRGAPEEQDAAMRSMLRMQVEAAARARSSPAATRDGPWLLSAGGSAYFDVAAAMLAPPPGAPATTVLLRSGCYLTHDHVRYANAQLLRIARSPAVAALGEGLRPALEVWGSVQSRPEPGRVLVSAGKRDLSHDLDLPVVTGWCRPWTGRVVHEDVAGHRVVKLNDQHAYLDVPAASPLVVGDLVRFGISHPCTTFDRWQLIYLVDDAYTVVDAIRTFF
jgi:D-serine dehydratase